MDHLDSSEGVDVVAVGDLFPNRAEQCLEKVRERHKGRVKVTPATVFLGFDAFHKILEMSEIDIVLLATPPAFRPTHVRAAVDAKVRKPLSKIVRRTGSPSYGACVGPIPSS